MKIRKISILLAFILGAVTGFQGCTKDDGAIPSRVTVENVPALATTIDASGSQAIDLLNLSTFAGKFKVDIYFAGTTPPAKIDISVRKNGSNTNNTNVKVFKTNITTIPVTLTVSAAEITALFGTIALGDYFDFAPDIYVGEKKYEAFPAVAAGSGPGVVAMPLNSEAARFSAICAYNGDTYTGVFKVIKDDWQDWFPGDNVTLTKVDATHFSFIDPFAIAATPVPIVVTVNTANNQASIPKTVIGTLWNYGSPTYSNPAVATSSTAANSFVSPCDKQVTLSMLYYWGAGSSTVSAAYALVLKKP
jgi:hypothetical protein